jgi:putative tryptophan/tyrosine transport system substrate-binding protein
MSKKIAIWLLTTLMLFTASFAEAQQQLKKPHRIGILLVGSSSFYAAWINVFRQGLKELGYIEGKNIAIEYRYAEGKADRLPTLAAELVGSQGGCHRY